MSVFQLSPTELTDSQRQFLIPPTIMSDYHNYLHTEVPNVNFDFTLLHSWYDQFETGYKPTYLRAEHFPINWKSKIGNSDASKNFYMDYDVQVYKGDMCIREDGLIVMLNWEIQQYINAQTTQAVECNHVATFYRHMDSEADSRGFKIKDAYDKVIVDALPVSISEYAGRPDYQLTQNAPGVMSDMLTDISVQWNEQTKNIKLDDWFEWMGFKYRVINMSWAELNIDKSHGILKLNARRIAGEM